MARIFIDAHMFSEAWFPEILREMIASNRVTFVYGEIDKLTIEISKVRQALNFYKAVKNLKTADNCSRRVDAARDVLEARCDILSNERCFVDCTDCDDPHIFALIYVKPTRYVFSRDARMARCRDTINPYVESRYCRFRVISTEAVYRSHRQRILN